MTRSALIFGITGQDGSFLAKSLLNKNYDVFGVSRSKQPNRVNHKLVKIEHEIDIRSINLSDIKEIGSLIEKLSPNEIYNLAGQSSVGISFLRPLQTLESIVDLTRNILESSRELDYDGNLFFAGSGEIFGETKNKATRDSKINPKSPYAVGKYASMLLVKLYRDSFGLNSKTGILFNHESFLRGENFVTHKLMQGAIECCLNKNKKIKLGNLSICRDWGCAEEYVEAMQLINRNSINTDHVICTGIGTSLKTIVQLIFECLGLNWEDHVIIDETLFRESDVAISIGSPDPLLKELGWKATKDVKNIYESIIHRYLKLRSVK